MAQEKQIRLIHRGTRVMDNGLTPEMQTLKVRNYIIQDVIRQGYQPSHAKYMADLLCPTPAQARARKMRKAKKEKKENGT